MEPQRLWDSAERLRGAADEAARLVQNFYISFLLLGTYIAVIIGSTTDMQLLKVSPVTLPLLNVQLPIVGFYVFVPWLLLLFYFNLLMHLTLLAQKLHRFNTVLATFTDHVAREEQRVRLFPFPFSVLLIGRPAQWRLRALLGFMVRTTVLWVPLVLLLWAQVRFLPYHHELITWSHRFAVLADLALLWLFWPLIRIPGQGEASAAHTIAQWQAEQHAARRTTWTWRFRVGTGLLCLTLVTVVFSLGIAVLPEEWIERLMTSHMPKSCLHDGPDRAVKSVLKPTYWLFETPRAPFYLRRNLWLQEQVLVAGEPSAEVLAALHSGDEHERAQGLKKITGLILTNRDLRGADLRDTLFAKADLRGANLKGVNLRRARVFVGNFANFLLSRGERCIDDNAWESAGIKKIIGYGACHTNLQGADLREAQLQGATLRGATWRAPYLERAQLQGADLREAQLQGADLREARLQGADLRKATLWGADLQGADLRGADLQGADLRGADLEKAQYKGPLSEDILRHGTLLQEDWPQKDGVPADYLHTRLQGANLREAQLQGANLREAQLQGANLREVRIGSADFTHADLTLSNLQGMSLLSLSPLDEQTYTMLEQSLTDAISNERYRKKVLNRIKAFIGDPARLVADRSAAQVLCDVPDFNFFLQQLPRNFLVMNKLPSCLTHKQIADYAQARAAFLAELSCTDGAIMSGLMKQAMYGPDEILIAFAKRFAAIREENCPGWAALSAEQKGRLRRLAAQPSIP